MVAGYAGYIESIMHIDELVIFSMTSKFQRLNEKISKAKFLLGSTVDQRRESMPIVKPLQEKHIQNCKLVENRQKMLEYMPKKGICAEIGILECSFSDKIHQITQPEKLHLIDIDQAAIEIAKGKFNQDILNNIVVLHLGDSANIITSMPDHYFDWVYVDGDHSYEAVKKDLDSILPKLKLDGLIAVNDYIFFDSLGLTKLGVIEAVNEFCIEHNFELVYFALQGRMYNDVVLRRIA